MAHIFEYQVEKNKKHRITVVGTYQTTKLYVDGVFKKILYAAASDPENNGALGASTWTDADNNYRSTFVFPLNEIGKNFSGYIRSHVACQEEECVCNVLCLTNSSKRNAVDEWINHFFWKCGNHIGTGDARCNRVYTDMERTKFPCEGPGQTVDRIFTGWIGNAARLAADADH